MNNKYILEMQNITKSFGGVKALDNVDFNLKKGEIHSLVGENGAGKSTLMKILLGMHQMDAGRIILDGKPVLIKDPHEALVHRISMIHQEISLVQEMDVAENVWLGREKRFLSAGLIDNKKRNKATVELLNLLGVNLHPTQRIKDLSVAEMQLVELARAVSYDPLVIIMDEPTSALTGQEIELLYSIVRSLAKKDVSVVFISHKLEEIFDICQRVTVLRDGKRIDSKGCEGLGQNDLIEMIVGRKVDKLFEKKETKIGGIVFRADRISNEAVHDVSFEVRGGEVFGLYGLMGAGRSEILRAIFGIDALKSGSVYVNGVQANIRMPKDALRYGMGMVTEDRLRQGVIHAMSIMGNTTLAFFDKICNRIGFFRKSKELEVFGRISDRLAIKYDSPDLLITSLSGGNQQKVVIGRWLLTNPDVLLLDEPTRGIDVGAKMEVYTLINDLARRGIAIVLVSSEMPELFALSDRIGVVRSGELVFECECGEATQEILMRHAFGI